MQTAMVGSGIETLLKQYICKRKIRLIPRVPVGFQVTSARLIVYDLFPELTCTAASMAAAIWFLSDQLSLSIDFEIALSVIVAA
jgi:hypothetical protein